jgi:ATP-binding cassette subfamily B protein
MKFRRPASRRFFAPEVIQTTSIDCGPAALRSSLLGFGIDVSYERLREACQTDVDGTSVDAIESVATELGLSAEQVWVPLEHLTIPQIAPLPALVVVRLANGLGHVIVVWRRVGPLFQIMDPASGRRWITAEELTALVYEHELETPADVWREWAATPEFEIGLRERLRALGADTELLVRARADASIRSLASLDAALRVTAAVHAAQGLARGRETRAVAASLFEKTVAELEQAASERSIPASFFSALPVSGDARRVRLRGAVIIRLRGTSERATARGDDEATLKSSTLAELREPPMPVWGHIAKTVASEKRLSQSAITLAIVAAAVLAPVEALLLRAFMDLGPRLQTLDQRLGAVLGAVVFVALVAALELWNARAIRALGRRLELRLRASLFAKVPRLRDTYFQSRPAADMAHRAHLFHPVRDLPALFGRLVRLLAELVVTVVALVWLDPSSWALTSIAALACVALPHLGKRALVERDLQVRIHGATLAQFCLDGFLGLTAVRAHGAERALRWEHGSVVLEWARAARRRVELGVWVELFQSLATVSCAALLIGFFVRRTSGLGATLLFAYWSASLPVIGQELASLGRVFPRYRNLLARVLEPLFAPEARAPLESANGAPSSGDGAMAIEFEGVHVHASGQPLLKDVSLSIAPGQHVAVVGTSGAGKSTLVGMLLGWRVPDLGRVLVDGIALDEASVGALRERIAWVDPAVTLWNRSLLDNVRYGSEGATDAGVVIQQSELVDVLERMPDGLQTSLGEGGRSVSGGEGQRVRLARALTRRDPSLVILDEPFRGLDRDARRRLLARARHHWRNATLICITHDVADALDFDKVVVVEAASIVEADRPHVLATRPGSEFAKLLSAHKRLRDLVWGDARWRRARLVDGELREPSRTRMGASA